MSLLSRTNHIVYVTRDCERALGILPTGENYSIITNNTPAARVAGTSAKSICRIRANRLLSTAELLLRGETKQLLKKLKKFSIVVFKNTSQIEKICREAGWRLLNPPASLASHVEEKISQVEWLGPLKKFLPPHKIILGRNLTWPLVIPAKAGIQAPGSPIKSGMTSKKIIVQFNRAHTGGGTILITTKKQAAELKTKFPNRPMRVTRFVAGPAFTLIACVWGLPRRQAGKKILTSSINYQITGLLPFTERPFATIGNDWALPHKILSDNQQKTIKKMALAIGARLAKNNWRGLFGIDVIVEKKTGKVYLIEINARQQAGTTFESQLQQQTKDSGLVTTFEAHLAALLGLPYKNQKIAPLTDGAQIILRVPENRRISPTKQKTLAKKLERAGLVVTPYQNTRPGEDYLRIQSQGGLMQNHAVFNALGKTIAKIIASK